MRQALLVDGGAPTIGAVAGPTSYVAYVESAVRAMPGLGILTLAVMVATSAIDQAMLVGFVVQLTARAVRRARPNLIMVVTTVLLAPSVHPAVPAPLINLRQAAEEGRS